MKNVGTILTTILLMVVCFAISPPAQALLPSPTPDGDYPGGNTAEGHHALFNLTTGIDNTAIGLQSLSSDTTGSNNTAIGSGALTFNLAGGNTATGSGALERNTTANDNTADGAFALFSNHTGQDNTATGASALYSNFNGSYNTATGSGALNSNTTGVANTATGYKALFSNSGGAQGGIANTATGYVALWGNTTGRSNTADGASALYHNQDGSYNTAVGLNALDTNTSGSFNTANGAAALYRNTSGSDNTAAGYQALLNNTNGVRNTGVGEATLNNNTSGSGNIALGLGAGFNLTSGDFNIDIGNAGVAGEGHTIRIGRTGYQTSTYIAGIHGVAIANGTAVIIDGNGHLGTVVSSERFKKDIANMGEASEAILSLKPATFYYKNDQTRTPQFGLVAEEVAKVNPTLVLLNNEGKPYTVRYDAVNAMLLNEFLKEHRKLEGQQSTVQKQQAIIARLETDGAKQGDSISKLKKEINVLSAQLKEQAGQIQKVSARIEATKPTSEIVFNRP